MSDMKKFYVDPELVVSETEDEYIIYEPPKMPFWQKLSIYCSIWLAVIIAALFFTLSAVKQYDRSMPRHTMDDYISLSKQEIFFDAISTALPKFSSRYEPTYSTAGRISDMYTSPLTYIKLANEYTDENPVYMVQHAGENMFKVTLERADSTGFMKFPGYRVKHTELVNENLLSFNDYYVVFSSDSFVFINERKLESKLSGVFEMVDIFGGTGYYGIMLKDMLLEPKISAQRYDRISTSTTPLSVQRFGNYFMFPISSDTFFTYTITAPANALITIGGQIVSDFFVTKTSEVDGKEIKVYTVPTVCGEQVVRAQIGKKEVTVLQDGCSFTVQ